VAVEVTYTHANEPHQKTLMNVNSASASFVGVSGPTLETEIRKKGTLRGKGFLLSCLTQGDTETERLGVGKMWVNRLIICCCTLTHTVVRALVEVR